MDDRGVGVTEPLDARREGFLHAVEVARLQHDPVLEWNWFVEALWGELASAFGFDVVELECEARRAGRCERRVVQD